MTRTRESPAPADHHVADATLAHFRAIPWCVPHLSDPSFRILHLSRTPAAGHGHSLMAETWNTDATIRQLLSLYRPAKSGSGQRGEIRRFYTFGTGLNAHPQLLHGGVIAAILDSTMGNVTGLELADAVPTFTATLTVSFKTPIATPGTILARASVTAVDGRKIWVRGQLESGDGLVYATAEGMWLKAKAKAKI